MTNALSPLTRLSDAVELLETAAAQWDPADRGAMADALRNVRGALAQLLHAEDGMVAQMRRARVTWQEIADVYGVTRSAAQQRFRHIGS